VIEALSSLDPLDTKVYRKNRLIDVSRFVTVFMNVHKIVHDAFFRYSGATSHGPIDFSRPCVLRVRNFRAQLDNFDFYFSFSKCHDRSGGLTLWCFRDVDCFQVVHNMRIFELTFVNLDN